MYNYKVVSVFGLGISGVSTIRYFINLSVSCIYIYDDNNGVLQSVSKMFASFNNVIVMKPCEWEWNKVECLVLAPGVPLEFPEAHEVVKLAKNVNCRIISDVELLWELKYKTAKFVVVSGTNGKTTTTTLIGSILKCFGYNVQIGGNIGVGVLDLDLNADIYVLELSSYQLDLLDKACFDIAVLLNIASDHLERYGDILDNYINSKKRILYCDNNNKNYIRILGVNTEITRSLYSEFSNKIENLIPISYNEVLYYGVSMLDDVVQINLPDISDKFILSKHQTLIGIHNNENIMAAYITCINLGCKKEHIISVINSFCSLDHRIQVVAKYNNVIFVNDSKATNIAATQKALLCFRDIYWIVGGKKKNDDIRVLKDELKRVKKAYIIGESRSYFDYELGKFNLNRKVFVDLFSAIDEVMHDVLSYCDAQKELVVLFSPACSSFDQFRNYEHRGEVFTQYIVESLKNVGNLV